MERTADVSDNRQLICCDWLQFWCKSRVWAPKVWSQEGRWKFYDEKKGTRVFSQLWRVTLKASATKSHREEPFCVVARAPYSSIIDKDMVLVKVENRYLYQEGLYDILRGLLALTEWEYQAITRIDLACDLHTFADNLHPRELIARYLAAHYVKAGTNRNCVWQNRSLSVSDIEKIGRNAQMPCEEMWQEISTNGAMIPHQISFGGATSDVHVKMYNKTKEIDEESGKRYIKAWWKQNGMNPEKDVWRVEISITRRSRTLAKVQDGEIFRIGLLEATNALWMKATFFAMAKRHFHFKTLPTKPEKRSLDDVPLWTWCPDIELVPATNIRQEERGRTAKVCANFLLHLRDTTDMTWLKVYEKYPREVLDRVISLLQCIYSSLRLEGKKEAPPTPEQLTSYINQLRFEQNFGITHGSLDFMRDEEIIAEMSGVLAQEQLNETLSIQREEMLQKYADWEQRERLFAFEYPQFVESNCPNRENSL